MNIIGPRPNGFRERGTNPCIGIRKNPRRNVARFLDTEELARLGRALDAREAKWLEAVAAIRLLALTGCRRGEVLNLRWRDIGDGAITLPETKTGPRTVRLGEAARMLIEALPGAQDPDACLFPRHADGRGIWTLTKCWRTVCGCEARQAAAARLAAHGGEPRSHVGRDPAPVGKLLGHRRHSTTAGYAHLADIHLVETAEKVGNLIANAMNLHIVLPPSRPRERCRYGRWI